MGFSYFSANRPRHKRIDNARESSGNSSRAVLLRLNFHSAKPRTIAPLPPDFYFCFKACGVECILIHFDPPEKASRAGHFSQFASVRIFYGCHFAVHQCPGLGVEWERLLPLRSSKSDHLEGTSVLCRGPCLKWCPADCSLMQFYHDSA